MAKKIKIEDYRAAVSCAGITLTLSQCDLLVTIFELVQKKGGKTDMDSLTDIQFEVKARQKEREEKEAEEKKRQFESYLDERIDLLIKSRNTQ